MTEPDELIDACLLCAGLFRLGRDVEAALRMVDLFDALAPRLAQAGTEEQRAWGLLVNDIFSRQQLQDWLGVADALQYELVTLITAGQA